MRNPAGDREGDGPGLFAFKSKYPLPQFLYMFSVENPYTLVFLFIGGGPNKRVWVAKLGAQKKYFLSRD